VGAFAHTQNPVVQHDAKPISLAQEVGLKKIVLCSAWGRGDIPQWFKWLMEHSNIRFTYEDHERQESLLLNSSVDWTIVQPTSLTNAQAKRDLCEQKQFTQIAPHHQQNIGCEFYDRTRNKQCVR